MQFLDIRNTVFPENHFDCIICNHVICDIKEDKLALSEIYRILKKGGLALLQVPITKVSGTVEDEIVKTKEEREIAYGYGYYERIYNDIDYADLLSSVGFNVEVRNLYKEYEGYGLNPKEDLYM